MQSEVGTTVLARYSEDLPIEVPPAALPDGDGGTDRDGDMEEGEAEE